MKPRLQTSLGQHLVMTPQLRQAIRQRCIRTVHGIHDQPQVEQALFQRRMKRGLAELRRFQQDQGADQLGAQVVMQIPGDAPPLGEDLRTRPRAEPGAPLQGPGQLHQQHCTKPHGRAHHSQLPPPLH